MSGNEIPIFFKRRFHKGVFENYLVKMLEEWTYNYRSKNFREFEVNVITDSIHSYFKNLYDISVYSELDLIDTYKFQKFIDKKYEKVIREYWDEHH
jgi:hypothetical protein